MKEVLVIYGDCQVSYLEPRLRRVECIASRFDVYYVSIIQSWMVGQPLESPLSSDIWARCTVFWRQVGPENWPQPPEGYIGQIAEGAKVVTFPSFWFSALWALSTVDPLMAAVPPAHPIFPYHDRDFVAAAKTAHDPADVADIYNDLVTKRWPTFERTLDFNLQVMAKREAECDVHLAGYIISNFKTARLLWNPTNQTNVLAKEIVRRLMLASHLNPFESEEALVAAVGTGFEEVDPPHFQRFPIPPVVAERFGLTWWHDDDRYWIRLLPEEVTWREYVKLYVEKRSALEQAAS